MPEQNATTVISIMNNSEVRKDTVVRKNVTLMGNDGTELCAQDVYDTHKGTVIVVDAPRPTLMNITMDDIFEDWSLCECIVAVIRYFDESRALPDGLQPEDFVDVVSVIAAEHTDREHNVSLAWAAEYLKAIAKASRNAERIEHLASIADNLAYGRGKDAGQAMYDLLMSGTDADAASAAMKQFLTLCAKHIRL